MSEQQQGVVDGANSQETAANARVCDFYIQPRGCIKGDACDFQHPVAPNGNVTTRLCDFFSSARGCTKGVECDFLHIEGKSRGQGQPQGMPGRGAPSGGQSVCKFFQMPQGCKKGVECEFFHPPMHGGMGGYPPMGAPMGYGQPMGQMGGPMGGAAAGAKKQCDFFFTARGCVKGDSCDFSHAQPGAQPPAGMYGAQPGMQPGMYGMGGMGMGGMPPQGAPFMAQKKPQKCDFFATERGCIKGELCDFIHVKEKVCDFHLTERGCRKGKFCDFQHPGAEGAIEGDSGPAPSSRPATKRYAPY